MNIALIKSHSGHQGGLEKYTARIAQAFLDRGAHVHVLTTGDPVVQKGLSFHVTKTAPWPGFLRMEQFDRFVGKWVESHRPDLVFGMERCRHQTHIRAGNGVHAAYLQSRRLSDGKAKALLCQFNPLHRKILQLEKAAFENPGLKKLFTNSHMVKRQILSYYKTDPAKIEVIHNGVEWEEMEKDFGEWEERRIEGFSKFGLNPDLFHFLFIGNGYSRKGLDQLLEGLSRIKERNFHLSVVGKDNHMDAYLAKAVQLGLKDRVRFFGPSQEIRLFYQLADALVIPSFYDPFANVTIEALAMGLYVVSSKNNGGCEIISASQGKVIEDLLNPDAMTDALKEALNHRKTRGNAKETRNSVKHLDFSHQLRLLVDRCG